MKRFFGLKTIIVMSLLVPFVAQASDETDDEAERPSYIFSVGSGITAPMSSGTLGIQGSPVGNRHYYSPEGITLGKFDARFGFFVTNQWVINLGVDFSRVSTTSEEELDYGFDPVDDGPSSYSIETEESATFVGFLVGAKYYFSEPTAGQVSFYNQASFSVMIPFSPTYEAKFKGGPSSESMTHGVEKVIEDVYAIGISEGIGAEYFVSDYFSIGGEFGLKASFMGFDEGIAFDVYHLEFYSGITLNFLN